MRGRGLPEYVDLTERAPTVVARSGLRRGWEGRLENIFAEMSLGHRRLGGEAWQLTKRKKRLSTRRQPN